MQASTGSRAVRLADGVDVNCQKASVHERPQGFWARPLAGELLSADVLWPGTGCGWQGWCWALGVLGSGSADLGEAGVIAGLCLL